MLTAAQPIRPKIQCFAAHEFHDLSDLTSEKFTPKEYSHLKFGVDSVAKKFGYTLAEAFFKAHTSELLANQCVVIPSPYNHVKNAATTMSAHFVDRLNDLLAAAAGRHLDTSHIHRKVSYTGDFGFLTAAERDKLIGADSFYLNREFVEGKLILFLDDVRITGAHEKRLIQVMRDTQVDNRAIFVYYGLYTGTRANIEAEINFGDISSLDDIVPLMHLPDYHLIVRPIKFILGRPAGEVEAFLKKIPATIVDRLYHGCLGEGYFQVPKFQANFNLIKQQHERTNRLEKIREVA